MPSQKPCVLVVDDQIDILRIMRRTLEMEGYRALVADSGDTAMRVLDEQTPDLIILDIMMPEKDGFVACKELKGDPACKDIPILILTAVGEHFANTRYAKSMGMELEAEDYIDKPIDPKLLVARLAKLLKK